MSPEQENSAAKPSAYPTAEAEHSAEAVAVGPEPAAVPAGEAGGEPETPSPTHAAEISVQAASDSPAPGAEATAEDPPQAPEAPDEGDFVEGRVIAVTDLGVVVDIGAKSEGLIPASEFVDSEASLRLGPGQTVEVQRLNERKEGYVLLSYHRARRRRAWESIERSYREHTSLTAQVVDRIKGGLVVDLGIRAFLPASQVDLRPTHDLDAWKGKEIACRVLKMNRKRGNVVVSRRVLLEDELRAQRQKLM